MSSSTSIKNENDKNYYYLIVGILFILSSLALAWRGQSSFLLITNASDFDLASKTTIFYVWHILTVENLIFGVAFIVMAFCKDLSKVNFTAWMIAIITVARWSIILGSTLFQNRNGVTDTLTESIVMLIFVGLIILGTRENKRLKK